MVSRKRELAAENRDRQEVYRKKHGENLRKARRVATSLMALRSHEGFDVHKFWRMKTISEKLEDFFVGDEMQIFISIAKLTPAERQAKADDINRMLDEKLGKIAEGLKTAVKR